MVFAEKRSILLRAFLDRFALALLILCHELLFSAWSALPFELSAESNRARADSLIAVVAQSSEPKMDSISVTLLVAVVVMLIIGFLAGQGKKAEPVESKPAEVPAKSPFVPRVSMSFARFSQLPRSPQKWISPRKRRRPKRRNRANRATS